MNTNRCIFIVAGILAALAFRYCPVPWSAGFLLTAVLFVMFARMPMRTSSSALMVNIAAVLFALAILEGYIGVGQLRGDGTRMAGTITNGFTHADDTLGYAPDRNARVTARKYYGDTLLYDVVYSIDGQGLRVAPPSDQTGVCAVFFGCSITFGYGVNDDQTFPYRVGVKTNGRYTIRNFAFNGYGPHQMLANLQSSLFSQRLDCEPTHLFYLAIPQHIARVAGLTFRGRHDPRFTRAANGEAVRTGNFDDPVHFFGHISEPIWVKRVFDTFFTWQRFFGWARDPAGLDRRPEDVQLFVAVVRTSARISKQRFPDSHFHVLLQDDTIDERLELMEKELQSAGVSVHRISEWIPDLETNWTHYILSDHDPHPNALQHELIANNIVRNILAD